MEVEVLKTFGVADCSLRKYYSSLSKIKSDSGGSNFVVLKKQKYSVDNTPNGFPKQLWVNVGDFKSFRDMVNSISLDELE